MAEEELRRAFGLFARNGKLSPKCITRWICISSSIGLHTFIGKREILKAIAKVSPICGCSKKFDFGRLKKCIKTLAKEKKIDPNTLTNSVILVSDIQTAFDFYATKQELITPDYAKKWLKDVGIIGEKSEITEEEVDCFLRVKPTKYHKLLDLLMCMVTLSREKELPLMTLLEKLTKAEGLKPGFKRFAAKDGKLCFNDCLKNWFKEANIIGMETGITEADVGFAFTKTTKSKKALDFASLKKFIKTLAKIKKIEPNKLNEKLAEAANYNKVPSSVDADKVKDKKGK